MIDQGHGLVRAYFISRIKCVAFAFKFIRQKKVWITFTIIFFTVYYSFIFISFDKLTLSQTTIESKQTEIEKYNTTNLRIIQCIKKLEKKLKNSRIHPKLIQPR